MSVGIVRASDDSCNNALQSRGLRTDRSLLVILDGAQALHTATRAVFGEAALIQRCQVHKLRNILDHLPERQRPWVQAIVRRAYQATDVKTATRLLTEALLHEYPLRVGRRGPHFSGPRKVRLMGRPLMRPLDRRN